MASTAAAVRRTSSPLDSPVTWDVPPARAASSRARWEIDLSPGTRSRPRNGRPLSTVNVATYSNL